MEVAGWSLRSKVVITVIAALGGVGGGVIAAQSLRTHVARPIATSASNAILGAPLTRQAAAPFTLTDQDGKSVSLSAEKGHVVLLTFLDPQCRQLCPLIGKDIGALEKQLPSWVHPVLLIVSVAPGRTRADVTTFLVKESPGWLPGWHWLLGPNEASLKLTWAHWHIAVIPNPTDIAHDALLDIIDAEGYLRVTYPAPLSLTAVVADVVKIARS